MLRRCGLKELDVYVKFSHYPARVRLIASVANQAVISARGPQAAQALLPAAPVPRLPSVLATFLIPVLSTVASVPVSVLLSFFFHPFLWTLSDRYLWKLGFLYRILLSENLL